MMRTRLAPRGYCPLHELRFAIISGDGRYLVTNDVPFGREADIDAAFLWTRRREAEDLLTKYRIALRKHRVVQVREEGAT